MKYVIAISIVILTIFILILTTIPIGIEPLTEVYFENHTKLPANLFLNRSYNFSFSVHNLEYKEMKYDYTIHAEYGNFSKLLSTNSFILADNQTSTFFHNFSFQEQFERAKIKVVVIKENQETIDIHFWVDQIMPLRIQKVNETLNTNTTAPILLKSNNSG